MTLTDLTIGNFYFIQVHDWNGDETANAFDICVTTPPPCTVPNPPLNPIVFNSVTSTSIDGGFTVSAPAATGYLVLMNTSGTAPTTPNNSIVYTIGDMSLGATVIDNDGNTNFSATGLNANTTYYFYVYSYNNQGNCAGPTYSTTNISDDDTTENCGNSPTNILVNVISATEATVTWNEPNPSPLNGYDFYLTTSTVLPNNTTTPTGPIAVGVDFLNLTGLNTNTTYYFWIRSNCGSQGLGFWVPATINTCDITSSATACGIIAGEQGNKSLFKHSY